MCGIGVSVGRGDCFETLDEATLELIHRRGPDHWATLSVEVPIDAGTSTEAIATTVQVWSSVLSLRGDSSTAQPVQVPNGTLCFNGEIYEGLEIPPGQSDTTALAEALSSNSSSPAAVATLISALRGPWAFVYICEKSRRIYFGRDIFGRRCLLIRQTGCGFQLTSVASKVSSEKNCWEEIPAQGIYIYDIVSSSWSLMQWDRSPSGGTIYNAAHCSFLRDVPLAPERLKSPIDQPLLQELSDRAGVFEGQGDETLDFDKLLAIYEDELAALEEALTSAVIKRLENVPQRFASTPVGILFSGGIDSTVLTALAVKSFPQMDFDLINVAFEHRNPRGEASYDTPDRLTSIEAFQELLDSIEPEARASTSTLRLVCVDVSYEELQQARGELHVPRLVNPANTVLDDSIGFALWFAARGRGYDHATKDPYESKARLLMLGMGADEQLGGYSRHAASFKADGNRSSWESLHECTAAHIDRISWRNLGRDDRVLADLSKEGRTPFLDEDVVSLLNSVPLNVKMRLDLPRGTGDKLILRMLAHKMRLPVTARRAKRALQFGSRIAHADPKRTKGHIVCNRFDQE